MQSMIHFSNDSTFLNDQTTGNENIYQDSMFLMELYNWYY
jgi:hypothetical protein